MTVEYIEPSKDIYSGNLASPQYYLRTSNVGITQVKSADTITKSNIIKPEFGIPFNEFLGFEKELRVGGYGVTSYYSRTSLSTLLPAITFLDHKVEMQYHDGVFVNGQLGSTASSFAALLTIKPEYIDYARLAILHGQPIYTGALTFYLDTNKDLYTKARLDILLQMRLPHLKVCLVDDIVDKLCIKRCLPSNWTISEKGKFLRDFGLEIKESFKINSLDSKSIIILK